MSNSKYKIIKKIGEGGMGSIYLGHDQILDRPVAIKVLSSKLSSNNEFMERFLTEARVCAKLNHPNIIKIFDFGTSQSTNQAYFVMEFVDGESLADHIKFNKIGTEKRLVEICKSVLSGLKCSHDQGILHRDIKPENILINEEGRPVIMDFGIAKLIQNESITRAGETMGTPEYMSPEQVLGNELNCQTDIYSFGILMYYMITGRLPFQADTPIATALKHVNEAPIPPSKFNSSMSHELENIILKAIQKNKSSRYQNASEIIKDLESLYGQNIGSNIPACEIKPIKTDKFDVYNLGDQNQNVDASQPAQNAKKLTTNGQPHAIQNAEKTTEIKPSIISFHDIIVKSIEEEKLNFHELLFDAITDNDTVIFNFLIDFKIPIDVIGENNSTPLMHSIRSNSNDIFDLLISNKVDVNFKNKTGETPLMIACAVGDLETVKILIKKGANQNIKNSKNEIAFNYAENKGYSEITNYLLNISNTISETNDIEEPVNSKNYRNGNLSLNEILQENIANGNLNSGFELFQSIETDKLAIASILIKQKLAGVNITDKKSNTPLHQAVKFNNKTMAELLINNGANFNSVNNNCETPLHIACFNGNIDLVSLLIAKTDYNIKNSNNKTALDIAKEKGTKEIIKIIEATIKSRTPSLINRFMDIFK
ncbi:MAG: Serine/threonine-protein kinase PknB [bacterium ADurb.Bin243]|nr:MAG: Serine/threonine-protein kinase PknB [bacterium ADurb.Bin243]